MTTYMSIRELKGLARRELRSAGITQAQAARDLDVTPGTVSKALRLNASTRYLDVVRRIITHVTNLTVDADPRYAVGLVGFDPEAAAEALMSALGSDGTQQDKYELVANREYEDDLDSKLEYDVRPTSLPRTYDYSIGTLEPAKDDAGTVIGWWWGDTIITSVEREDACEKVAGEHTTVTAYLEDSEEYAWHLISQFENESANPAAGVEADVEL